MFSKCLNWFLLGAASSTKCVVWYRKVLNVMVWYRKVLHATAWYGMVSYPAIVDLLKGWSGGVFLLFSGRIWYFLYRNVKARLKMQINSNKPWGTSTITTTLGWLFFENYEGTKTDISNDRRHCHKSDFITCTVIANDTIWVALFTHGNTSHPGTAPFSIKGAFSAHGCLCPWIVCALLQAVQTSPHGCQIDSN